MPTTLRALGFARTLVFSRMTIALLLMAALGVFVPYARAGAGKSTARKHSRLHVLAHAFVNVTVPGAGHNDLRDKALFRQKLDSVLAL